MSKGGRKWDPIGVTAYERIFEATVDSYGLITVAKAKEMGIRKDVLYKLVARRADCPVRRRRRFRASAPRVIFLAQKHHTWLGHCGKIPTVVSVSAVETSRKDSSR